MSWMDQKTGPTMGRQSERIAHEVDEYRLPKEFDLLPDDPEPEAIPTPPPSPAPEKLTVGKIILDGYNGLLERARKRREAGEREEASKLASVRRWALRIVAIFASLSCAIASVYFSRLGLLESQPAPIAMVMALTIVATLTVAPELSVSLHRKRRHGTALVVSVISLVATLFSMSQTVTAIYNAKSEKLALEEKDDTEAQLSGSADRAALAQVSLLRDRISRLQKSMETDQGAVASYQGEIDRRLGEGEAPDSRAIALLVANRNAAQVRVNKGNADIGKAEDEIGALSLSAVRAGVGGVETEGTRLPFHAWLAGRMGAGIGADAVEFALAVFPALFIDIIAPAMLVVAFAL